MDYGVDTGPEEGFRVVEIEDVRGDPQLAAVRLVDDGSIHVGRHLRGRAEVVVHADLDDVRLVRGDVGDPLTGFVGRLAGNHLSGQKQAGPVEGRRVLRIARLEGWRLLAAEAPERGDAVAREHAKLAQGVLARVGAGRGALHVGDVHMGGDEPRQHDFAVEARRRCAGRDLSATCGAEGIHPAIPHDHQGVVDRLAASRVDHPHAGKGANGDGRGGGLRRSHAAAQHARQRAHPQSASHESTWCVACQATGYRLQATGRERFSTSPAARSP